MNIPSVMSIKTSCTRWSFADVTAKIDETRREVTLNFRQLPAVKIDALHRLMFHTPEQPSMDLARELRVFSEYLWMRYGQGDGSPVYTAWAPEFSYEIVVQLSSGAKPYPFVRDLKDYFRKDAGIILRVAVS